MIMVRVLGFGVKEVLGSGYCIVLGKGQYVADS